MRWIAVWTRAVGVPASRRADAATLGAALVAAVAIIAIGGAALVMGAS
jgi:hypothetical protein